MTASGDERSDILASLREQREFLRFTVRGLTDEQACERTTASELTLGGILKHVSLTEQWWVDFMLGRTGEAGPPDEEAYERHANSFRLLEGESLVGVLDGYQAVAKATEDAVASLPDLEQSRRLPEAPWFEPGATWSARRVLMHILRETAHHCGHADIVRESLDGQKTMG